MTMSKSDICKLIAVIGLLAVVAVYFMMYRPYMEDIELIKADNESVRSKIARLNDMVLKKEQYQQETAKMENKVSEIYDMFPAKVMPEDVIAQSVAMEAVSGVMNTELDFEDVQNFYTPIAPENIVQNIETGADEDGASDTIEAMSFPVKYFFTADLDGVEKACNFLNSQNNRDVISGLAMSYDDETGTIKSEILLVKNYIIGTGKPYSPATFPNVMNGVTNPFRTRDFLYISDTAITAGEELQQEADMPKKKSKVKYGLQTSDGTVLMGDTPSAQAPSQGIQPVQ